MTTRLGWSTYAAAVTAITGTTLNALASGTAAANFKLGDVIDNRASEGHGYLYGDLEIVFRNDTDSADATITAGAGAPFLDVYWVPSIDGTRFATTNGAATAGLTQSRLLVRNWPVPPSIALGIIYIPGITLRAPYGKIMLNNQLGVAFPTNNHTICRLHRHGERTGLT